MASRDHNRIDLLVRGRHDEATASGIIKPGHIIEYDANDKVKVSSVANVARQPMVAFGDHLQGKTIDDAYAVGDRVFFGKLQAADRVLCRIPAGVSHTRGDKLMANAAGQLIAYVDAGTNVVFAYAAETLNNNPGTADAFLKVEIANA